MEIDLPILAGNDEPEEVDEGKLPATRESVWQLYPILARTHEQIEETRAIQSWIFYFLMLNGLLLAIVLYILVNAEWVQLSLPR
ncbi:hypothetical protein [Phyllobacterium bourgognense]|uniref:hypothetical protein n=1 Tax=Phyllobacterium bourgognense TaxID=314236 RepID=UPI0011C07FA0|nr:hypothetical protein [Phyllobacterium bourgognense]